MVDQKIAVRINRFKNTGGYEIHSIKGAVTLTVDAKNQVETLRVGDEVSEEEIAYLTKHYRTYSVTIVSVKGDL